MEVTATVYLGVSTLVGGTIFLNLLTDGYNNNNLTRMFLTAPILGACFGLIWPVFATAAVIVDADDYKQSKR